MLGGMKRGNEDGVMACGETEAEDWVTVALAVECDDNKVSQ